MKAEELDNLAEWCGMLIDRTHVIRDRFLCIPSGMVIDLNELIAIHAVALVDGGDGGMMYSKIRFSFQIKSREDPIVGDMNIDGFPQHYYFPRFPSLAPLNMSLTEEERKFEEDKERAEAKAAQVEEERELEIYVTNKAEASEVVNAGVADLKDHIVELWADTKGK